MTDIQNTTIVSPESKIGSNTKIWHYAQIREGVVIGKNCIIGKNVYIDKNVTIGSKVKIQNNASLYQGVTIEDEVFIGPHVCFTNDKWPRAAALDKLKTDSDWEISPTLIKKGASIGANSTILPGITIGVGAMIGAGSVVTKNIPDNCLAVGNPARVVKKITS